MPERGYEAMTTEQLRDEWGKLMDTAKSYEDGRGFVKKYARPYRKAAREIAQIITDRGEACYHCGGIQGWFTDANNEDRCMHCHRPEMHSERKAQTPLDDTESTRGG